MKFSQPVLTQVGCNQSQHHLKSLELAKDLWFNKSPLVPPTQSQQKAVPSTQQTISTDNWIMLGPTQGATNYNKTYFKVHWVYLQFLCLKKLQLPYYQNQVSTRFWTTEQNFKENTSFLLHVCALNIKPASLTLWFKHKHLQLQVLSGHVDVPCLIALEHTSNMIEWKR